MSETLVIRVNGTPIAVGQRWRMKLGGEIDLVVVTEVRQVEGKWSRVHYRRKRDNSHGQLDGPTFLDRFVHVSDPRDGMQRSREALGVFAAMAGEPLTREQLVAGMLGVDDEEREILGTASGRAELLAEAKLERERLARVDWLDWREEIDE